MQIFAAAVAVLTLIGGPTPPAEYGTDWDNPRTAAPPVAAPHAPSCSSTIVDTEFRDFTPYTSTYQPSCAGPWQKVVLRLDGAVAGRQYDRLGYLTIGGVTVFKTSTPEPSVDGITWSVEKDVTEYAALLTRAQPVEMLIGNVVDDTYTGVLDVTVKLTFYRGAAAEHPDILPTSQAIPRNTEKLFADVYATGSGGGCEEFWYLTTPTGVPYSCPADNGPYREVQISIDGKVAGIAAPYPHIYTGGWSNPFLWYVLPAPRAFDIQPIRYDLTPFAGLLTDGKVHDIAVTVVGVPAGQSGWDVPTVLLAWRDKHATRVTGELLGSTGTPLRNNSVYTAPTLHTTGGHSLTTTGYVDTSHGRVTTSVSRTVANTSTHTWNADESQDALQASWTDTARVTVTAGHSRPSVTSTALRYGLDGAITIDSANRLTTTIKLSDAATRPGRRVLDTYQGEASWLLNVPRDQRHATGTATERYRVWQPGRDYDHTITVRNGTVVVDRFNS
ncbi:peptide-N4-asparagine amidase [Actinoplanes sp. N902-109]|uniref:peptide-N4-asparagine amidase n=1 Tax=Actinoplanes sp. (strain N902-109) TaxID=649831 RepID=UPI0003296221|nr:peptide-N4-asparagine amidase [Actinoplanes sp. N902-109]AGL20235.1 peptide-N4-asparagine amidase A [Actinoplanes sp. N902-109]